MRSNDKHDRNSCLIVPGKGKNAVVELSKIQRKYIPGLFKYFGATADPRDPRYITYSNTTMLGQMYFKGIAGIVSMQGMTEAFKRLAEKIKKRFPRLPILLMGDSLYACEPVMEICRRNGWDYLLRFKDGRIPSVAEEYNAITEKGRSGNAEFVNAIEHEGHVLNVLRYEEKTVTNNTVQTTKFQWITNLRITEKNAEKIAATGRLRWKIENEGFNRQKSGSTISRTPAALTQQLLRIII